MLVIRLAVVRANIYVRRFSVCSSFWFSFDFSDLFVSCPFCYVKLNQFIHVSRHRVEQMLFVKNIMAPALVLVYPNFSEIRTLNVVQNAFWTRNAHRIEPASIINALIRAREHVATMPNVRSWIIRHCAHASQITLAIQWLAAIRHRVGVPLNSVALGIKFKRKNGLWILLVEKSSRNSLFYSSADGSYQLKFILRKLMFQRNAQKRIQSLLPSEFWIILPTPSPSSLSLNSFD